DGLDKILILEIPLAIGEVKEAAAGPGARGNAFAGLVRAVADGGIFESEPFVGDLGDTGEIILTSAGAVSVVEPAWDRFQKTDMAAEKGGKEPGISMGTALRILEVEPLVGGCENTPSLFDIQRFGSWGSRG